MSRFKPTHNIVEFLKENIEGHTFKELANMVNAKFGTDYTAIQITGACNVRNLFNGLGPKKRRA